MKSASAVSILVASATSLIAQDIDIQLPDPLDLIPALPAPVVFVSPEITTSVSHEFTVGLNPVKGQPYSADEKTESVQTLGDGNRIVHSITVRIYRDGQGRVRREITRTAEGTNTEARTNITISDPVAGVSYSLDPKRKTARKMPLPPSVAQQLSRANEQLARAAGQLARAKEHVSSDKQGMQDTIARAQERIAKRQQELSERLNEKFSRIEITPPTVRFWSPGLTYIPKEANSTRTHEDLGTRDIEGVPAKGTRETTTIPAGAIGNERPIVITSENWFSPDLQMRVKSVRRDPRAGETTFTVTNLKRSEPDPSLFQVPADYTVQESRTHTRVESRKTR